MKERLQKIIAAAGLASRRGAEEMVLHGRVLVNGEPATIGQQADPDSDEILVDGRPLRTPALSHSYIALNKPTGFVTSRRSTHGERTVMELLPDETRLIPVGRLDKDTSGLLFFTSDGEWANLVTHPRYGVDKEYLVLVKGCPSSGALRTLRDGVLLPDGSTTSPARVLRMGDDRGNATLTITVAEGKKRQIRLMLAAVGHPVISLRRVRIGSVHLGRLPEGRWRELLPEEVESIRENARHAAHRSRPEVPSRHRD